MVKCSTHTTIKYDMLHLPCMVFKNADLTRDELKAAGRQVLDRFNAEGPKVLQDPEVRKTLERNDGVWTVGNYLAYCTSVHGLRQLKLAIAADTELLRIGHPEEPVANTLALRGDSAIRKMLLGNPHTLEMQDNTGWNPIRIILAYGNKEEKRDASLLLLMRKVQEGSIHTQEIRGISSMVREAVMEKGTAVLDDPNTRKLLFTATENGWSVAHQFAHGRGSKLKRRILMHFAGDPGILALSTSSANGQGSGITVESLIREKKNAELTQKLEATLAGLKRP